MVSTKDGSRRARTMRLKSCPKCSGDVVIDSDHYGWYEQCLQCGYMSDLPDTTKVKESIIPARYQREKNMDFEEDFDDE